jgi:hypothetical protein
MGDGQLTRQSCLEGIVERPDDIDRTAYVFRAMSITTSRTLI